MLAAAGLAVLAWSNSLIVLAGAAVLYAGAMAAIQPVCLAWATDRAPASRRGAAIATTIAAQDLGIGAGSFAAGAVADVAGLAFLFDACALLALGGLALVLIVSRRPEGTGPRSKK
jgi:predicted MFS family arabinose efflux permease